MFTKPKFEGAALSYNKYLMGLIFLTVVVSIPYLVNAYERHAVRDEMITLIHHYYDLHNQNKIAAAEDLVDQRLKNISDHGLVQQYLLKDAVLQDARRYENMLKYHSDYQLQHQPSRIHIQTTTDLVIAAYYVSTQKISNDDGSVLEEKHNRVTWVLGQKNDKWVLLHEHRSIYQPSKD